jgi:hypothetical protein
MVAGVRVLWWWRIYKVRIRAMEVARGDDANVLDVDMIERAL